MVRFDKVMVSITLPAKSYERLIRQAFKEHRSPGKILSDALEAYVGSQSMTPRGLVSIRMGTDSATSQESPLDQR